MAKKNKKEKRDYQPETKVFEARQQEICSRNRKKNDWNLAYSLLSIIFALYVFALVCMHAVGFQISPLGWVLLSAISMSTALCGIANAFRLMSVSSSADKS